MRSDLPTGTVTFPLADVDGSTLPLHDLGAEAHTQAGQSAAGCCTTPSPATTGSRWAQGDAFFVTFRRRRARWPARRTRWPVGARTDPGGAWVYTPALPTWPTVVMSTWT
jgi:hypothetical protein